MAKWYIFLSLDFICLFLFPVVFFFFEPSQSRAYILSAFEYHSSPRFDTDIGNAEVTGSNPVEALIFFRLLLSSCLNWKINCDDHASL